jgi:hypothetical protein
MFYTFIVLFEKSSTLIDLMDLCKDFIRKEESDKPSLNGLGVLQFWYQSKGYKVLQTFQNIYIIIIKFGDKGKPHSGQVESVFNR